MVFDPTQGTLFGVVEDAGDGLQTEAALGQSGETGLDAAGGSMSFDPEGQDLSLHDGRDSRGRWKWRKDLEQSVVGLMAPGVESGAGDTNGATEGSDDTILTSVGEKIAGALHALSGRARMRQTHVVLPGSWLVLTPQPYHQGVSLPDTFA
jgi:hypothetical protein